MNPRVKLLVVSTILLWGSTFPKGVSELQLQTQGIDIVCVCPVHRAGLVEEYLSQVINGEVLTISVGSQKPQYPPPYCWISGRFSKIRLQGESEVSRIPLKNAIELSRNGFSLRSLNGGENRLILYGTLFENTNHIKSVSNLCTALRENISNFRCFFIDVTKNLEIFTLQSNVVIPQIDLKTPSMSEPAVITEKFPNLGMLHDKGFLNMNQLSVPNTTFGYRSDLLFCNTATHPLSKVTDPLFINVNLRSRTQFFEDTGISKVEEGTMHFLEGNSNSLGNELLVILFTVGVDDCRSCSNAIPHLKQLKSLMRLHNTPFHFVNCETDITMCSHQNVTGFPTLRAFKSLGDPETSSCEIELEYVKVVPYHGAYQTLFLREWYLDLKDLGVQFRAPHDFEDDCNIHVSITTSSESTDGLKKSCLIEVCKSLSFVECFFPSVSPGAQFVSAINFTRRDGLTALIYEDGVPLENSFARTAALHKYHRGHHYDYGSCSSHTPTCYTLIRRFIQDHSRMPLTELTPLLSHSLDSYRPLFGDLPVLVALVHHQTTHSGEVHHQTTHFEEGFMRDLEEVARRYYTYISTTFVDVDSHAMWVHGMSPKSVGIQPENSWIYKFPRVLIFRLDDHYNAAFLRVTGETLDANELTKFIKNFMLHEKMEPCNGI